MIRISKERSIDLSEKPKTPFLFKVQRKVLTILGDIKVFKYPMFVVYDPGSYKVKGEQTRQAMKMIRPGDLVLRGYDNYLDGKFIPGEYSHTGVYVGGGIIIHAIAEGVQKIDIIDFLRCDRFIILRPSKGQKKAIAFVHEVLGAPYDFKFEANNASYYCHELGASAYIESFPIIMFPPYIGKKHKIVFHKLKATYLCDSFLTNSNFKTILEFKGK